VRTVICSRRSRVDFVNDHEVVIVEEYFVESMSRRGVDVAEIISGKEGCLLLTQWERHYDVSSIILQGT
jgi:hypothetical protein